MLLPPLLLLLRLLRLLLLLLQARRTEEYVKLALEGVGRLRSQIQRQGGVDFLTRLELDAEGDAHAAKRLGAGFAGAGLDLESDEDREEFTNGERML